MCNAQLSHFLLRGLVENIILNSKWQCENEKKNQETFIRLHDVTSLILRRSSYLKLIEMYVMRKSLSNPPCAIESVC